MTATRCYLDYNATAPIRPEARTAVIDALEQPGNASSVHGEGRYARRIVEDARERVAGLVGAEPAEVVFTSGATEANNWVLGASWDRVFLCGVEHESVLVPAHASDAVVREIPVDSDGVADLGVFAAEVLRSDGGAGRDLLSLQMANNEAGVVQDVAAAADFARRHGIVTHSDAVQAIGRVPVSFEDLGLDLMSLSSHKIGGPMGVGALIVRDGFRLPAYVVGGGQERRRRAGTENVAAIAGFGAAAEAAASELPTMETLRALRDRFEQGLKAISPDAIVIGENAERLPNTICVAVPEQQAETLVIKFDLAGIALSAGSACSSGKVGASHVLSAMGLAPEIARGAIRISLGWNTSETDLETFLSRWRAVVRPSNATGSRPVTSAKRAAS